MLTNIPKAVSKCAINILEYFESIEYSIEYERESFIRKMNIKFLDDGQTV